jgi:hypothetical protein
VISDRSTALLDGLKCWIRPVLTTIRAALAGARPQASAIPDPPAIHSRNRLGRHGAGQLVERDLQLTGDPGGDRDARFALVLLEIGEVGLGYVSTGRQVGLGQSADLARGADLLAERRGTLDRGLVPALLRQQAVAFGEDLVLVLLDQLAQAAGLGGFIGG